MGDKAWEQNSEAREHAYERSVVWTMMSVIW